MNRFTFTALGALVLCLLPILGAAKPFAHGPAEPVPAAETQSVVAATPSR